MNRKHFYGWPLVGVGFLFYGLGIAPAYYSWGFFAPEMIADLDLSRQQVGEVFGTFTLIFALTSMLSAAAINRWGLRITVTIGALVAALGWSMVGKAESLVQLYLSYALLGGIGIGLSTLLPAQTLSIFWFKKYRARAIAVILLGAAVFGALVNPIDAMILEKADWRTAWMYISATSIFVAIISGVFLRNRPEDIGQRYDGQMPLQQESAPSPVAATTTDENSRPAEKRFSLMQLVATPQFMIATFADIAIAVPWRVITVHGRLHLENIGFAPALAAAVLGVRVGMSGVGRLSGALSDFARPTHVMAIALIVSGLGVGGFCFVESANFAYASVTLIGIGYGAAFTTIPVIFGSFFGRDAFVSTAGLRVAITGVVGFIGPSWAGATADKTGSYTSTLIVLAVLCLAGAVMIFPCRAPESYDKS